MEDFTGIINWDNVFKQSETFKKNKPFKFAFIEGFFVDDFYEKLYQTYPKFDDTWVDASDYSKSRISRYWGSLKKHALIKDEDDPKCSKEWNRFVRYARSPEFAENFRKFSGVPVTNLKYFSFAAAKKGGFQLPHIHNEGPSTLIIMAYFSKNWQQGDPGGTYVASEEDESSIIFEPYNLDNTMVIFHDGPHSAHGVRYISKDVERRAIQIYLEEYSPTKGWSGRTT